MLGAQRLALIMEMARTRGAVRVAELTEALGVSEATIRRQLARLIRDGRLTKVHGGAVLAPRHVSQLQQRPTSEPRFRTVTSRPSLVVGAVLPASSYYFGRILNGVRGVLQARGHARLLLGVSGYDPAAERALVNRLVAAGARAALGCVLGSGVAGWT